MEKNKIKWKRKCPKCGKEIPYTTKCAKIRAEKRNTNCKSCIKKGKNNPMYGKKGKDCPNFGKKRSKKVRKKISESLKGIPRTEETKQKISKSTSGKNNPMYGKCGKDNPNYGRKNSEEVKRKCRLSAIKRVEKNKLNGGQLTPNYNHDACKKINEYNKKYGYNFQHAENGGEVCVDGYFPDGVDEKRKTIIEIDEKHHFDKDGNLKKKDVERQKYLESLGYEVIRINI